MISGETFIYEKKKTKEHLPCKKICSLINYVEYYLNCVFISVEKVGFRLVVIHNRRVLTNKCYTTLKRAKIGFARRYNQKSWKKGVKPKWSQLYVPGDKYISDKIGLLRSRYKQWDSSPRRSERYFLANSAVYNLEYALITVNKKKTRLLVLGDNRLLKSDEYKNLKAAKIAFTKSFLNRGKNEIFERPEWLMTTPGHLSGSGKQGYASL